MDGLTDMRTDSPCVLQKFVPLRSTALLTSKDNLRGHSDLWFKGVILLDKIEGLSSENNFFLWSILTVVTHKISSSIAYQLLKILHHFIQLMFFPIKLSKRTGRQWVLGKKIFLFVLLCLILWQWFFFYTTLWLTSTLSLMHHNENSCWYSITESPLEKSSIKLPSTLFLSA